MSKLFDASRTKSQLTLNGAVTHESSLNKNVDLFYKVGTLRKNPEIVSEDLFWQAFSEDSETAVRVLLYSRDIRGGMGERNVFRKTFKTICNQNPSLGSRLLVKIPELGRWDDVLEAIGTPVEKDALQFISDCLTDKSNAALCAKWMPRMRGNNTVKNKNNAKVLAKFMKLSYQEYNKLLSSLSDTVEQNLSSKDYSDIDYSKLPSLAAARYQALFNRVDSDRYAKYRESLIKEDGQAKINAGAVYPYDIVKSCMRGDKAVANAQWKSLPDYTEGTNENIICLSDVSGSMTFENARVSGDIYALHVGIALSIYIAERNTGIFKDQMMVYSTNPYFIDIGKSLTLAQKLSKVQEHVEYGSTDIMKAFARILELGKQHNLTQEDMPSKVIVFSDMEFNQAISGMTNFESISLMYSQSGYKMPQLVFWNLASQQKGNVPVQVGQKGTALVSGFSPSIMKGLLTGELEPVKVMQKLVNVPRYDF